MMGVSELIQDHAAPAAPAAPANRATAAIDEVRRLSGLLGYPRNNPDGEAELVAALLEAAPTPQAAQHLVDEALRVLERCPPPQYFYAQAAAKKPPPRRDNGCRVCDSVGSIEWPYLARPDAEGKFHTARLDLLLEEPPSSPDYQLAIRAAVADWRRRRAQKWIDDGVPAADLEMHGRHAEQVVMMQVRCPHCQGVR